jgi:hypothetical protein
VARVRVLSQLQGEGQEPPLPSWVPDWRKPKKFRYSWHKTATEGALHYWTFKDYVSDLITPLAVRKDKFLEVEGYLMGFDTYLDLHEGIGNFLIRTVLQGRDSTCSKNGAQRANSPVPMQHFA